MPRALRIVAAGAGAALAGRLTAQPPSPPPAAAPSDNATARAAESELARVVGVWQRADGGAAFSVVPCADAEGQPGAASGAAPAVACARLVWARSGAADGPDLRNRVRALRGRPLCGAAVFYGARARGPGRWVDGVAYDFASGRTHNADLRRRDDTTLTLRTLEGARHRTEVWRRGLAPGRCAPR